MLARWVFNQHHNPLGLPLPATAVPVTNPSPILFFNCLRHSHTQPPPPRHRRSLLAVRPPSLLSHRWLSSRRPSGGTGARNVWFLPAGVHHRRRHGGDHRHPDRLLQLLHDLGVYSCRFLLFRFLFSLCMMRVLWCPTFPARCVQSKSSKHLSASSYRKPQVVFILLSYLLRWILDTYFSLCIICLLVFPKRGSKLRPRHIGTSFSVFSYCS